MNNGIDELWTVIGTYRTPDRNGEGITHSEALNFPGELALDAAKNWIAGLPGNAQAVNVIAVFSGYHESDLNDGECAELILQERQRRE